jgi:hypothetical protein
MQYHIAINGVQSGPHEEAEVRRRFAAGELSAQDLCWREGWPEWRAVGAAFAGPVAPPPFPPAPAAPLVSSPGSSPARPEVSALAITSLVLGLTSFFASVFTGVPAVICGHLARARIRRSGGALAGEGLALAGLITGYIGIALFAVMLAIIVPTIGHVKTTAARTVDSSNLRQIGQASLIYAADHQDQLPEAATVWEYAAELARGGGLNDAQIWLAGNDRNQAESVWRILSADRESIDPEFRALRLSFVVPLGGIRTDMPSQVPIAWTRGLQADGTWAADSPYGGEGGHIVFLGGNVVFSRSLAADSPLVRYGTQEPTSDIREALPPGVRLSE